jgi:2-oxoglutarate ferredoxin oxidoreductase subunit beta
MLPGVAYSARCALDTVAHVNAAKKAIRKAFQAQFDDRGFGFVELLSGCPTNLHLDPLAANRRIAEEMIPYFPLGVYRDTSEKAGE